MVNTDFSIFPILYTPRLILKELTSKDADVLFEMRSNPDIMKYVDRPIPQSIQEIYELIEKMMVMKSKGEGISWEFSKKKTQIKTLVILVYSE